MTCPNCKSKATKLFHLSTGKYECQICEHQWGATAKCEECDTYAADPPSRLCPGCQAYREHQQ